MATHETELIFNNETTDGFRGWGKGLSDAIKAAGLVQTADTGQIDWTTVVTSTATNTLDLRGWEIFAFNDALQATAPLFLKVWYGMYQSADGSLSDRPGPSSVYVQLGNGTDGAGTLTSATSSLRLVGGDGTNSGSGTTNPNTHRTPVWASGDGSYLNLGIGMQTTAQWTNTWVSQTSLSSFPSILSIDRSRDLTGAATADGAMLCASHWPPGGAYHTSPAGSPQCFSVPLSRTANTGAISDHFPLAWPGNAWQSAADGPALQTFPMRIPTPKAMHGLSLLGTYNDDVPFGAVFDIHNLGAEHTYRSLSGLAGFTTNDRARANVDSRVPSGAVLMRWE